MPRLDVREPPQHGTSTGGSNRKRQPTTPVEPRRLRARTLPTHIEPLPRRAYKRRLPMSKDKQAALAVRALEIQKTITKPRKRTAALRALAEEFKCGPQYPRQVLHKLKADGKLPNKRTGGGYNKRITPSQGNALRHLLRENGFDMTFTEIQEATGFARSTVQRWMKREKWRLCSKSSRPVLTPSHIAQRLAWATKHQNELACIACMNFLKPKCTH